MERVIFEGVRRTALWRKHSKEREQYVQSLLKNYETSMI